MFVASNTIAGPQDTVLQEMPEEATVLQKKSEDDVCQVCYSSPAVCSC